MLQHLLTALAIALGQQRRRQHALITRTFVIDEMRRRTQIGQSVLDTLGTNQPFHLEETRIQVGRMVLDELLDAGVGVLIHGDAVARLAGGIAGRQREFDLGAQHLHAIGVVGAQLGQLAFGEITPLRDGVVAHHNLSRLTILRRLFLELLAQFRDGVFAMANEVQRHAACRGCAGRRSAAALGRCRREPSP